MILLDYIVDLGLDAFKGYLTEKYDERQMKADIKSYVAKQQKLNFNCAVEEELDFGGIVKYLCSDFHEDIEQRFTGETSKIRGQAHKHIVAMAASYAQAHTPEQKEHVKRMVNDALNILRSYYEKKLSREQKYLASRIADDVIQSTASQHEEQTDRILQAIEKNAVSSPLCHAQARQLAQEGKLDILGDALTDLTETVSAKHILSPYYGFHPQTVCEKQQFVSVPLTKDAQKMYPPHFECSGRAYIDGHEIGSLSTDIIEYANNHQLPIHFVVESARKFLGTHTDPQQCEAQAIIGKEYLLPPKPFPEAMAYSIVIDDVTYYEYLLIRTKERFEDGTAVFTNEAQEIPFKIKFKVTPNTRSVNFSFTIKGGSNSDHLRYERFLRAARSNGRLKIHHLESGNNLLEVNCNAAESAKYMEMLDHKIAFLEQMVTIEHYFNEVIDVPEQLSSEDVRLVCYIATLLQGKEVRNHWRRYETTMTIASQTKQNMRVAMDKSYSLTYVGTATVNIFGHSLTYPIMRTLCSVKLENPEKVTKLLDILEEGDDVPMVFVPGEETGIGEYVDQLGETENNT